jgi:hypothetical protein
MVQGALRGQWQGLNQGFWGRVGAQKHDVRRVIVSV